MLYSVIIPVYNRPHEIKELLESLTEQTETDFEVLVIEDGSDQTCKNIVNSFRDQLDLRYFYKENSGQGFSRNYGFENAEGKYFVVFDSDCIIPPHYFESVTRYLKTHDIDCWGGPDRAHPSFLPLQRAISFSMTSFLTTGGIRGKRNHLGTFRPRSFNMGISREVYRKTGGYKITRMGEDLEFSIRIEKMGFTSALIPDAYVYHKRRSSLSQFYKQLHFFGRARVNINRFHPEELKPLHLFPLFFFTGFVCSVLFLLIPDAFISNLIWLYLIYALLLFVTAAIIEKNLYVAFLATIAGFIQLTAYGVGFITELIKSNP